MRLDNLRLGTGPAARKTETMKVKISCKGIDRVETEAAVLLFFEDERPLKASSGLADWRMNGDISALIMDGRISGERGETVLIAPNARFRCSKILMIGLGRSSLLTEKDLARTASEFTKQLIDIAVTDFAVAPPPARLSPVGLQRSVSAVMRGIMNRIVKEGIKEEKLSVTMVVEGRELHEAATAVKGMMNGAFRKSISVEEEQPGMTVPA